MAHRRRQDDGVLDILFELARKVPVAGFVLGVLFAVAGAYYIWINPKGIYGVGSFIGGIAFLAGGLFGVTGLIGMIRNRMERGVRACRLDSIMTVESLRGMDWKQFEQLVADLFRRQGFRVREVGGSGDGGVDLVLVGSDRGEHLVQCKQYRAWSVGEPKVREFYGAMAAHRTRCEGIVVTCGEFTEPARRFADGKPLRLIDGPELVRLIRDSNPIAPAVSNFTATPELRTQPVPPMCPTCAMPMVSRTAKKGSKAGQPFWGCQNFPRCREIVQMD
jgi:restriction system protein